MDNSKKVVIPPLPFYKRILKSVLGRRAYATASRYWTYVLGLAMIFWIVFIKF